MVGNSVNQLVDGVFDRVLHYVEFEVVAPGTQNSVTDPDFQIRFKQWEKEQWLKQQNVEAKHLADSLSASERRQREIHDALQKVSADAEIIKNQMTPHEEVAESLPKRSDLKRKPGMGRPRQQPLPSSPRCVLDGEALERFQEAKQKIRQFRKEAEERRRRKEDQLKRHYNKVKAEADQFVEYSKARETMHKLQREMDSIERHKRYVVERSRRKQQLIKLQYDELTRNSESQMNSKSPKLRNRKPLYKRMEQEYLQNVELPLIEARKRRLKEIQKSKVTPTVEELKERSKLLKRVELAKMQQFKKKQRKLQQEWKVRRSRILFTGKTMQSAQEDKVKKKELENFKRQRSLELRERQRKYDMEVRKRFIEERNQCGIASETISKRLATAAEKAEPNPNLTQTVPTPPKTECPTRKKSFPHRPTTEVTLAQATKKPGKTLLQLQREAARLETEIATKEALISEKLALCSDDSDMANASNIDRYTENLLIEQEQEKLSELYVSTIENKMKVLEAVLQD